MKDKTFSWQVKLSCIFFYFNNRDGGWQDTIIHDDIHILIWEEKKTNIEKYITSEVEKFFLHDENFSIQQQQKYNFKQKKKKSFIL